jgi:chitodextrinase
MNKNRRPRRNLMNKHDTMKLFTMLICELGILCITGCGGGSNNSSGSQTTVQIAPETPQNLALSAASDTTISLVWDNTELAQGYEVYRDGDKVADATANSYLDTGLVFATSYTYSVRALNQYGESDFSNSVTGTTQAEAAGPVGHPEPDGNHGAVMPYHRYSTEDASYGGGAQLLTASTFDQALTASEASNKSYISLPTDGAYAEWKVRSNEGGAGITMRFTMPDSADGMGLNGSLDIYVNDAKTSTVALTSYYSWQYFDGNGYQPFDAPSNAVDPRFRFDEVHWQLVNSLQTGDVIRIQQNGGSIEYGVDFLEIEVINPAISQPDNSVSVTDFGAIANDDQDDLSAFEAAVLDAQISDRTLYIPQGTFHLGNMWNLGSTQSMIQDMTIIGAGIWHTNLQFTNANKASGGISLQILGSLDFSHIYLNSMLRSRYNHEASYKGFMNNFGTDSRIHNIWLEHFEVGMWTGDYAHTPALSADNLIIEHSRIRNNFADGVNFAQGTSNSTVRNCNVRNNGDDGLAVWTSDYNNAAAGENITFINNTIEFNWRAAAIAFFGGSGHKATHNLIIDTFAGSAFRMTTDFPGYHFQDNTGIVFSDSTIIRSGTSRDVVGNERGAITLTASNDPIRNVTISRIDIINSERSAIQMGYGNGFENIVFNDIDIDGTGLDGVTTSTFSTDHLGAAIHVYTSNGGAIFNNLTTSNISHPDINYIEPGFNLVIQP